MSYYFKKASDTTTRVQYFSVGYYRPDQGTPSSWYEAERFSSESAAAYRVHLLNGGSMSASEFADAWRATP